jgi:hypothetical protein
LRAAAVTALVEARAADARKAEERVRRLEEEIAKGSGPSSARSNRVAEGGKRAVLKATAEALARLKAAATLAPDSAALAQAVAAAERAVKDLTAESERAVSSTTSQPTAR